MNPWRPTESPNTASPLFLRFRSPTALAVTALCGLTLAFYHGLWLPGLVLIKRDAFRAFLPLKQYLIERLSAGELPQWFPYEALGRPFIGVAASGIFHPFTVLYSLFPVPDAYRASTLISCLLAALGAFALGRLLNFSRMGALLAAVAFALSGYVASLTDNIVYLYSTCLLPFFCAALEKALHGRPAWVIAPAALWATVFLNGDFQTGYYYGFIAVLWSAMRAPRPRFNAFTRLALVGVLAALLAAVQLGPTWAVFSASDRAQHVLFEEQALHWSTHPLRLVNLVAGPLGGDADPVALARSFFAIPIGGFWAESLYVGIPVVGLALLGARHRRDLNVLILLGSAALLLSLGRYGGLYEVLYRVMPLWSAFRYPEKFMGVVSFAAAMLAGAGVDALRSGRGRLTPWATTAVLCAVAGLGLGTEAAGTWAVALFGAPDALARAMTNSAGSALLWSALVALGVWLILDRTRKEPQRAAALLAALTLLITLDLARVNAGAYHTGPAEAATFAPPLVEAVRSQEGPLTPGRFRLVSIHENVLVWPKVLMPTLGYYGAASVERRQALDIEHNAEFHIETVIPYLPGYSSELAETLNSRTGINAAARLNVSYYIGRRYHLNDPQFARELVAEYPPYDLALFRNPVPAKPRVYLSRHPERTDSRVDPVSLIAHPTFLNGDVDVIETRGEPLPGPAEGGTARIERYEPELVRVSVETPQPAVLVLLDAYDEGWTAALEDGTPMRILRANALVRAVVVPAGTHVVTFSYQTPLLKTGAWASFAGILLCLGLIVHARRRSAGRHPD